jgi:hypothetical protein
MVSKIKLRRGANYSKKIGCAAVSTAVRRTSLRTSRRLSKLMVDLQQGDSKSSGMSPNPAPPGIRDLLFDHDAGGEVLPIPTKN